MPYGSARIPLTSGVISLSERFGFFGIFKRRTCSDNFSCYWFCTRRRCNPYLSSRIIAMVDQAVRQASSDPVNVFSSSTNSNPRSGRVLSCALCQQRKVKCDRNFPCANCRRSGAECVSTPKPQPRRRRFAERELLDRLRNYEELLRQHHVDFKPMHTADFSDSQDPEALAQQVDHTRSSPFEGVVDCGGQGDSESAYGVFTTEQLSP